MECNTTTFLGVDKVKWLSLFSGIGGFDLALERNGHSIVGACEIDQYARQVYAKHWGGTKIYEDATKINADELPDIDGICAGFPCQTFSIAGRRLGFEESRGTLFFEIARIAKQKRPRLLLLENVKGLLSHNGGETFAQILATLDELGYNAEWQVLNSKYFVPQNRERIFIIAYLRETSGPKVFPIRELSQVSSQPGREEQGSGEGIRSEVSTIDSRYGALRNAGETYLIGWSRSTRDWGIENRIKEGEANALQTGPGGVTQSSGTFVVEPELKVLKDSDQDTYRLYSDKGLARSLRASPGGMGKMTGLYDVNQNIRRLTPLECERLQGFPDGWTEGISDTQRYKCLGNAVTVNVVDFILKELAKNLCEEDT